MQKPIFSIIIPVYAPNAEFLRDSISSVLFQSYSRLELLLVCADHACDHLIPNDSRIRCFYIGHDDVSSKRNKGIEESTGDYLLFLDSDDMLHPNLLCFLETHLGAAPDISAFSFTRDADCFKDSCCESEAIELNGNETIRNLCFRNMIMQSGEPDPTIFDSACGKAWRREFLIRCKARFVYPPVRAEDAIFSRSLYLKADRMSIFPAVLGYYWRKNPHSTMNAATPAWLDLNGYLERIQPVVRQTSFYSDEAFYTYGASLFTGEVSRWIRKQKTGQYWPIDIKRNVAAMYTKRGTLLYRCIKRGHIRSRLRFIVRKRWLFILLSPILHLFSR